MESGQRKAHQASLMSARVCYFPMERRRAGARDDKNRPGEGEMRGMGRRESLHRRLSIGKRRVRFRG